MRRFAWLLIALSGCFELPDEYRIEDLRILEVRAEPPEIRIFDGAPIRGSVEDLLAAGFDNRDVRFSVIAAHPDLDADFSYTWIRCTDTPSMPGAPAGGFRRVPCDGERKKRLGTDSSTIAISVVDMIVDDIAAMNDDPVAAISTLASDPRDLFSGLLARINVNAAIRNAAIDVDTPNLDATKRLVIYDPAIIGLVLELARSGAIGELPMIQGIETPSLCTKVSDAQLGTLYDFLENRVPNRPPNIRGLRIVLPNTVTSTAFSEPFRSIELRSGEQMRMNGVANPDDPEEYRVIDDNCELIELEETLAWSWFVTDGTLSKHITSQKRAVTPIPDRTIFTAPRVESEQRVRIHAVVRDGRGGSDSLHFDVLVRP